MAHQEIIQIGDFKVTITVEGATDSNNISRKMKVIKMKLEDYYSIFKTLPSVGEILGTKDADDNIIVTSFKIKERYFLNIFKRGPLEEIPPEIALTIAIIN